MKLLGAATGLLIVQHAWAWSPAGQVQQALQGVLRPQLNEAKETKPPNIIFVITDDQDLQLDSVSYTPRIQHHVKEKGASFKNHFVTTSLCCPSRVSLWTGRQAHNTNVTDVHPPYGELHLALMRDCV